MNSDLDNTTEMPAFITKNVFLSPKRYQKKMLEIAKCWQIFSANLSSAAFLPEWKKLSALYLKFADLMSDNLELWCLTRAGWAEISLKILWIGSKLIQMNAPTLHSNQNQCWKIIIIVVMMILMSWWYVWWKWCDMIIRMINWRWSRWSSFHHYGCDDAFDENNDATCRERHPAGKATSLTTPSFQDSRPSLALE